MTVDNQYPSEGRLNILSPDCLARIGGLLQQGIVFGVLDRRGHTSPYQWAFLDYTQFQNYLSTCGPGDTYEAWSIAELLEKGLVLAHAEYSSKTVLGSLVLSADALATIQDYLDLQYNEFIAVYVSWAGRTAQCSWGDIDSYDELIENLAKHSSPECEVYVFPLTAIDRPEHYLVKARYPYPNEVTKREF